MTCYYVGASHIFLEHSPQHPLILYCAKLFIRTDEKLNAVLCPKAKNLALETMDAFIIPR